MLLRLLLFISLFVALPAYAEKGTDIYTIHNVEIQAEASSASDARQKAFKQAEIEAFDTLLQRIMSPTEYQQLPVIEHDLIANTVKSFEVNDERIATKTYRAVFTLTFSQSLVGSLLEEYDVSLEALQLKHTLVVPLYMDEEGRRYLWENNLWMEAWRDHERKIEKKRFFLPVGDLGDINALPTLSRGTPSRSEVEEIAKNYGAEFVLVSIFMQQEDEKNETLHYLVLPDGTVDSRSFNGVVNKSLHVVDVMKHFFERVKHFSTQDLAEKATINAVAQFSQMSDWIEIQKQLRTTQGIDAFSIDALQSDNARISFIINSVSVSGVLRGLRASGLNVNDDNRTEWIIRR